MLFYVISKVITMGVYVIFFFSKWYHLQMLSCTLDLGSIKTSNIHSLACLFHFSSYIKKGERLWFGAHLLFD